MLYLITASSSLSDWIVENVFDSENSISSPLLLLLCEDAFELRCILTASGGFIPDMLF